MRRTYLIATVAALAITASVQAKPGAHGPDAEREQKAEKSQKSQLQGGSQRSERAQKPQKAERAQQGGGQRVERAQVRQQREQAHSQQREQARSKQREQALSHEREQARSIQREQGRSKQREQAVVRQQREQARSQEQAERRARATEQRAARQQVERRADEANNRALRQERQRVAQQKTQKIEKRDRAQLQRVQAAERRDLRRMQKPERQVQRIAARDLRQHERQVNRLARFQPRDVEQRFEAPEVSSEEFARIQTQSWDQRANRLQVLADRRERALEDLRVRYDDDDWDEDRVIPLFQVGQAVNPNWWYSDYVPLRYQTRFFDNDDYYYRYDGDWLYQMRREDNIVLSYYPLLGGAYSVGSQMPYYYDSYYNVPYGYNSLYYDTPDSYYRYGDGAIYQVNPTTQLIAGVVALLTGTNLGIGQMLPMSYNTYNVPYGFRDQYYDTNDMWWRYNDGYLYGVDPRDRMIQSMVPVYGGYAVGQPWPSYAGYDGYGVPGYYDNLYYEQPGYDYRYASNGIYQVDPTTQMISALVALVTGQNYAVGQQLPMNYGVYNVPLAYRDQYYDTNDNWYRYADGRIFAVDPGTRVINRVIVV